MGSRLYGSLSALVGITRQLVGQGFDQDVGRGLRRDAGVFDPFQATVIVISADRQFFGRRLLRVEGEDTLAVLDQRLRLGIALDRRVDDITEPFGDQPRRRLDRMRAVGKPGNRRCGDRALEFDAERRNRFLLPHGALFTTRLMVTNR